MQNLNFESFKKAIDICIVSRQSLRFSQGSFDSLYPPIETLKETFAEFRRLKEAGNSVFYKLQGFFMITASRGKLFRCLRKIRFLVRMFLIQRKWRSNNSQSSYSQKHCFLWLSWKKIRIRIQNYACMKLNDAPGMFKIFDAYTTLDKVAEILLYRIFESEKLPYADYYV